MTTRFLFLWAKVVLGLILVVTAALALIYLVITYMNGYVVAALYFLGVTCLFGYMIARAIDKNEP